MEFRGLRLEVTAPLRSRVFTCWCSEERNSSSGILWLPVAAIEGLLAEVQGGKFFLGPAGAENSLKHRKCKFLGLEGRFTESAWGMKVVARSMQTR